MLAKNYLELTRRRNPLSDDVGFERLKRTGEVAKLTYNAGLIVISAPESPIDAQCDCVWIISDPAKMIQITSPNWHHARCKLVSKGAKRDCQSGSTPACRMRAIDTDFFPLFRAKPIASAESFSEGLNTLKLNTHRQIAAVDAMRDSLLNRLYTEYPMSPEECDAIHRASKQLLARRDDLVYGPHRVIR